MSHDFRLQEIDHTMKMLAHLSRIIKDSSSNLLEKRRQLKKLELCEKEEERRMEELRQQAEDEAIAEERRRILEQHAPLLIGFLPPGLFRNMAEMSSLSENIQTQFRRHVPIQDDPDLWQNGDYSALHSRK
ncbi:hypothetical protein OUZ56_006180 [Daphnia magna]|uniref:Meiosis-specific nuclear structural protein 1 n=1 Tax=Daphnia magna TaxID=35525 RepID=A0ABQ9YUW9_9CRUS|nr:hypothetical protein OUZ56_006180 [Daphnia magna]